MFKKTLKKDAKNNLAQKENKALSERVDGLKKDVANKEAILKSVEAEYKTLIYANLVLREENEKLSVSLFESQPKLEEAFVCADCNAQTCNETTEVKVSVGETETEPKIEVISDDPKPEVKLSKSQLKKLKKQDK